MIRRLYPIVITIVAAYLYIKQGNGSSESTTKQQHRIAPLQLKNGDSLSLYLASSDSAVSGKIDKTATLVTNLKKEVVRLKEVIKDKDKQINALKETISDFGSNIGSKFGLLPISEKDRQ